MLKTVLLTLFFSSSLIALTDKPNLSQQPSNNLPFPTVTDSVKDNPVCLMQRENGTIINLSSICRKSSDLEDWKYGNAARRRALAVNQLNQVCRSSDYTSPDLKKTCENGLPY